MTTNVKITISWNNGSLSKIETPHLILRPIQEKDIHSYQNIFNATAMKLYRGTFNETRFQTWLARWKTHHFSALAIVDKTSTKAEVIGHAILGHGDYEGSTDKGWSEISIILHQAYWNSKYLNHELNIGTKGFSGLGTEVIMGLMNYAKEISQLNIHVPADIEIDKLGEVSDKKLYFENGKPKAVFLPLTEMRATCDKTNTASLRILKNLFKIDEKIGRQEEVTGVRPGFVFSISTKDL